MEEEEGVDEDIPVELSVRHTCMHVHENPKKNLISSWDSNPGLLNSTRLLLPLSY